MTSKESGLSIWMKRMWCGISSFRKSSNVMKSTSANSMNKAKTEPAKELLRQRWEWAGRVSLFVMGFILMTIIVSYEPKSDLMSDEIAVGKPAPRSIFSPFDVTYVNEEATEEP